MLNLIMYWQNIKLYSSQWRDSGVSFAFCEASNSQPQPIRVRQRAELRSREPHCRNRTLHFIGCGLKDSIYCSTTT